MKDIVNVHEAKTNLSSLLARVEAGHEVIIARANRPIARLVPYVGPRKKRRIGEAKGLVTIKPGFDELPPDFIAHFQ